MAAREYYNLFTDCWKLFRKYAAMMPLSAEAWAAEVSEKEGIIDQHAGCRRLARKFMCAIEDELEQLQRDA